MSGIRDGQDLFGKRWKAAAGEKRSRSRWGREGRTRSRARENNPEHHPCFVSHYCSNSRLIGNGPDAFGNTGNIWISLEELRFSEWRLPSSSRAKDSHITNCPLSFSPFFFFLIFLFSSFIFFFSPFLSSKWEVELSTPWKTVGEKPGGIPGGLLSLSSHYPA